MQKGTNERGSVYYKSGRIDWVETFKNLTPAQRARYDGLLEEGKCVDAQLYPDELSDPVMERWFAEEYLPNSRAGPRYIAAALGDELLLNLLVGLERDRCGNPL